MMNHDESPAEPLIAYVYGDDVPPDFSALVACGFEIVCLDKSAPWFREEMISEAEGMGLQAVAFAMKYIVSRTALVVRRGAPLMQRHQK